MFGLSDTIDDLFIEQPFYGPHGAIQRPNLEFVQKMPSQIGYNLISFTKRKIRLAFLLFYRDCKGFVTNVNNISSASSWHCRLTFYFSATNFG